MTPDQFLGNQNRVVEPPIWEMGHVGWFQEWWTLRRLDGKDTLFIGADELYNSFNIPNAERWELAFPTYKQTYAYITNVLNDTIARLERDEITDEDLYFTRLAINHEDMHSETMVHIRQTLGYTQPEIADTRTSPIPVEQGYQSSDILIPGGTYQLGALPNDQPFIFDNEKWAHPVEIQAFNIATTPVTQGEYLRFLEDGGYLNQNYWSDEGWEWRLKENAVQPTFWEKIENQWTRREFTQQVPIDPFLPMVHVNWYEASAYCRWAGRRLPTEAEWEVAASSEPGPDRQSFTAAKRWFPWGNELPTPAHANLDSAAMGIVDVRSFPQGDSAWGLRQMIGNVWEWTSDTFDAFPGYVIDPYETYSEPSFGQQKVLRGGCWVTRNRVVRNTFRNFYTPDRNNIYAGFRTVAK
jgi:iron(II)-dependent oxidoreductase